MLNATLAAYEPKGGAPAVNPKATRGRSTTGAREQRREKDPETNAETKTLVIMHIDVSCRLICGFTPFHTARTKEVAR